MEIVFSEQEKDAFAQGGIAAVVLFGSKAQGLAGPMSDLDIGILLSDHATLRDMRARRALYDLVYDAVARQLTEFQDIDAVFIEDAPAELRAHVMKYGIVLFAADASAFDDFKERTMQVYADFAPLRAVFQQATLARMR